jgi:hypothetical protein
MDRSLVSLEAFEANLRGTVSIWYLKDGAPAHAPGFAEQIYTESPPIQRKILLAGQHASQAWNVVDAWDIVYRPAGEHDWSIVLAILQNQRVPYLVCATPDVRIPAVFFQKLLQRTNPLMTFILYSVLGQASPLAGSPIKPHTYFFPSISPIDSLQIEQMESVIKNLLGNAPFNIKEALRDIYSSQAGLVVSRLETAHNSVYWYYASAGQKKPASAFVEVVNAYLAQGA